MMRERVLPFGVLSFARNYPQHRRLIDIPHGGKKNGATPDVSGMQEK
jgi:hypothetical protein